ncbi:hypothetical protein ACHAXT_012436 [Thalassiosira profunda]
MARGTSYLHIDNTLREGAQSQHQGEASVANPTGAVVPAISLATTFRQSTPGEPSARYDPNSFGLGYEYSRTGNPTRGVFERGGGGRGEGQYCVAFSSGSAATSAVVHLLSPGEKILSIDDVYGGTQRYFRKIVHPRMAIDIDFVDFSDNEAMLGKLLPDASKSKLFWLETPTNPTLKVTDIEKVSTITKRFNANALLAVDNTFCSPLLFKNPLEHGADIAGALVTKYINGHSDVAAARNAHAIALFLEDHAASRSTTLQSRQQKGFGAMITFYCVGGRAQSAIVLQNLRVFALAESLGAVESLAECPSLMTHASVPDEQRALLGIDDTLIRLSVGIESCADLVADLDHALNAILLEKPAKASSFLPGSQPAGRTTRGITGIGRG